MEQTEREVRSRKRKVTTSGDEPGLNLEVMVEILVYGKLRHLEEAANRAGRYVLSTLLHTVEVKVTVTRPANSASGRKAPEVSVEGTLTR